MHVHHYRPAAGPMHAAAGASDTAAQRCCLQLHVCLLAQHIPCTQHRRHRKQGATHTAATRGQPGQSAAQAAAAARLTRTRFSTTSGAAAQRGCTLTACRRDGGAAAAGLWRIRWAPGREHWAGIRAGPTHRRTQRLVAAHGALERQVAAGREGALQGRHRADVPAGAMDHWEALWARAEAGGGAGMPSLQLAGLMQPAWVLLPSTQTAWRPRRRPRHSHSAIGSRHAAPTGPAVLGAPHARTCFPAAPACHNSSRLTCTVSRMSRE